jgi:hypothetical protein
MKGHPWQTCHCYPDGCCPNRTLIDKVYVIAQLLSRSELFAIVLALVPVLARLYIGFVQFPGGNTRGLL